MIETSQESSPRLRQDATALLRQSKKAGEPIVLTINGKSELTIEDAESYQKLLELVDRLETLAAIREGAADMEAGRTYSTAEIREATCHSDRRPSAYPLTHSQ